MASSEQPGYPQTSYPQSSSVFYENEVKKDSEIKLRDAEVQHLLQQNREAKQLQQQQQQQELQKQLQQEQYEIKMEHAAQSSDSVVPVSSTTAADTSLSQSSSITGLPSDSNRLSQSEKAHMCMTCFKGFRNKPQLTQHELVHNNIRKHVCSYCEKAFKQICHLNQHIRVHTGERPYKCDVEGCGRSFAQLSNLNHHKKNHEEHVKRDVSRQFRCEVCERSYATKHSLNTHIQKLHTSVKLLEGTLASPLQSLALTQPRKRKKNLGETDSAQHDTLMLECDSDEDGLPTQVKVKPSYGTKTGLTVRIGTPPGNGDRDRDKQNPRTTLPLPFSSNQSHSSPVSVHYQQSPGQGDFITTFSDTVSQGQSYRDMLQSRQPLNLFTQTDPEQNHPNISLHDNPHFLHSSATNTVCGDGQEDEQKILMEQLSKSEAIIAEQRELMQAALSHRDALLSRSKLNYVQRDEPSSSTTSHVSQMQSISPASVSLSEQGSLYRRQQGQISQSDVPSHITHHYPKNDTIEQSRSRTQQIFNPAFTEQNKSISQTSYNQAQY